MLCSPLRTACSPILLTRTVVICEGMDQMTDSATKLKQKVHQPRRNIRLARNPNIDNWTLKKETSPYWSTSAKTSSGKRLSVDAQPRRTYSKRAMTSCSRDVLTALIDGPTGQLKLASCELGVHELTLCNPARHISRDIRCELVEGEKTTLNKPLEMGLKWLQLYFDGSKSALSSARPPLCPQIFNYDSFRSSVWCTLEKHVQFGETVSYGELARLSGSAAASQAVGSAMRNNPVSLIVPCHRVILASGKTGNYAGGKMNDTKVWLLEHEEQHGL